MARKKKNISTPRKSGAKATAAGTKRSSPLPAGPTSPAPAAVLDEQKLQQLYSFMLKCQMFCRIVQEISPSQVLLAGREAVLAGALAHSRREDYVATAQNAVLARLLRGDPLSSIVEQLFSDNAGVHEPANATPGQLALIRAMGAARDLPGSGKVALAFCGEDPAAFASQQETLALAAKHKAPVVCLIETSLPALKADVQSRGRKKKSSRPQFPAIVVDGADVVAVFRVAQEAVRRARNRQGPSLIQCVMPDEGSRDPLAFMEQYLRRKHAWSDEWRQRMADEFAAQLEAALTKIESPWGE